MQFGDSLNIPAMSWKKVIFVQASKFQYVMGSGGGNGFMEYDNPHKVTLEVLKDL